MNFPTKSSFLSNVAWNLKVDAIIFLSINILRLSLNPFKNIYMRSWNTKCFQRVGPLAPPPLPQKASSNCYFNLGDWQLFFIHEQLHFPEPWSRGRARSPDFLLANTRFQPLTRHFPHDISLTIFHVHAPRDRATRTRREGRLFFCSGIRKRPHSNQAGQRPSPRGGRAICVSARR